ncbi:MAG: DUF4258 domain-containing protein [Myxococcaceae bacterium]
MVRPDKILDLMPRIRVCIEQGTYFDTRHAAQRQRERKISRLDVLHVLKNGHHEKRKDKLDEHYSKWNYAIKGKDIDRRELRVIVSFDDNNMLIITAIERKKEG